MVPTQHIILIGFKSVGKSTIGHALAENLRKPFIDLDRQIEALHGYSVREIMLQHGEEYFRKLEHEVLTECIKNPPAILSLGGGTPLLKENQNIIKNHYIIHIEADQDTVFQRIMAGGLPAFFPKDQEPFHAFLKLWEERMPIYTKIANFSVKNDGMVVEQLIRMPDFYNT